MAPAAVMMRSALGPAALVCGALLLIAAASNVPAQPTRNLDNTLILPPGSGPGMLDYPRRRPGLWEIRYDAGDNLGMPPTHYCVGEETDTHDHHLDRTSGVKGSCTIGAFRRVGIDWIADSVCKESRSTVVSQSIASGDFQTSYRIDTLVFYSPPLANNKREDKEAVTGRYLGACPAGQRPGDLTVPGLGVLNMGDGTLRQGAPAAPAGKPARR